MQRRQKREKTTGHPARYALQEVCSSVLRREQLTQQEKRNRKEIHETDNCHLCLISPSRPASRFGFQKLLLENKWQSPQEKEEGSQFFTGFHCTNPCKKEVRKLLLPGNQPHLNGVKIQISPDKFVGE